MKYTSLIIIFVISLISILVISFYGFSDRWSSYSDKEGFITFKSDTPELTGDIIIPTYSPSSRVFKLYDNMFFDNTNGNLIQANGQSGNTRAGSTNLNLDNVGTSLSSIIVYSRNSSIASININTQLTDNTVSNPASYQSKKTGYDVSFSEFMVSSNNENEDTTDNYQTLYIAWGNKTFIDVINTSGSYPKTLLGALFSDTQLQAHKVPDPLVTSEGPNIKIKPTRFISDPNDGRLNNQTWYGNRRLYQVCSFLHYDVANGNIVLKNNNPNPGPNTMSILDRRFVPTQPDRGSPGSQNLESVTYEVHTAQFNPEKIDESPSSETDDPQFFIYYVGFGQNTLLVVLKKQNRSTDMFKIVKVARFSKDGYVEPTSNDVAASDTDIGTGKDKKGNTYGHEGISQSDWELLGIDILMANQIDYIQNNYVKKTDMVPPIYPTVLSCSSCSGSNNGVCTNCGGNGGSGTVGAGNGDKEKSTADKVGSGVNNAVTGVVGLGKDVVGGAVGLGKDTLDLGKQAVVGTVDLGKETVGGAVDLTKQGISGAANIAERTVGGAVELGKETVGGAVDLTKQAATGAVNELNYLTTFRGGAQGGPGRQGGQGGQGGAYPSGAYPSGQQGVPINYNNGNTIPGVDPYSGYGSLVNKGNNFMPLTASFSAFGK